MGFFGEKNSEGFLGLVLVPEGFRNTFLLKIRQCRHLYSVQCPSCPESHSPHQWSLCAHSPGTHVAL